MELRLLVHFLTQTLKSKSAWTFFPAYLMLRHNSNVNVTTLFFRHDDLKQMLDSNRDNLKLEAMKRIIGVS